MFILSLYYIQNMEKMQKKKEIELHAQYSIIIKKFIFFKRSLKNIVLNVLQ